MLGHAEMDGRDYMVRQMKNLKASIPVELLTGASFNFYAWVCGAILARAHARTGDSARIAGYCGKSTVLDEALAEWAESYGDQTEQDHAKLLASIKRGNTSRLPPSVRPVYLCCFTNPPPRGTLLTSSSSGCGGWGKRFAFSATRTLGGRCRICGFVRCPTGTDPWI